jgi:tryptophanyl-tRNA synthetase
VNPGDEATGLEHQKDSGGDVPWRQVQFPECVEPSRGEPREIDGRRAHAPDSGGRLCDRKELARVLIGVSIPAEWKPGADQRSRGLRGIRHANWRAVHASAKPTHGCEQLAVRDVEHHGDDRLRFENRGDRDGVRGNSVQEVGGSVQRVDDERQIGWKRLVAPAFLAEYAEARKIVVERREQIVPDNGFGVGIDLGEVVRGPLRLPDEIRAPRRAVANDILSGSGCDDHRVEDSGDGLSTIRNGFLRHCDGSYISRMARVFSGIQPSGELHIGNYLGAIRNWVALQDRYESFFCIVDYHAITVPYEPADLRRRTREMAISLIASGVDPAKCTLFVQSTVSEHTELAWIFNTVTPLGELERQTQFKEKAGRQESLLAGLLIYPVLQAADIALYQSDLVPVGEDQVQHLELAREIARRWNTKFGVEFFVEPKPFLTPARRIMGLDGRAKMSKSLGNTVGLLDEPSVIWEKLRPAVTDPARVRKDDPGTPEVCNVYQIHKAFSAPETVEHVAQQCRSAGWGCIECKRVLLNSMDAELAPIRARASELRATPELLDDALSTGSASAKKIASATLGDAKQIMGLR